MTALPTSSTARFKVFYTVGPFQHVMDLRSAGSPGNIGTIVHDLLTALAADLFAMTVDRVQFAVSGSGIFNDVVAGIEGNADGSGAFSVEETPNYVNFIARSSGGRRLRLAIFGIKTLGANYRFTAGENTGVDAAIARLISAAPFLLCIDGLQPIWKSYANAGRNVFWQKAVRP